MEKGTKKKMISNLAYVFPRENCVGRVDGGEKIERRMSMGQEMRTGRR